MKSIVLSCDKYHPMTNHMILTYQKLWPSNKLKFLVPWNEEKPESMVEEFGSSKVELVNTSIEFCRGNKFVLKNGEKLTALRSSSGTANAMVSILEITS